MAIHDEVLGDTNLRSTIHTMVSESDGGYVAECLEVAVVTQGPLARRNAPQPARDGWPVPSG